MAVFEIATSYQQNGTSKCHSFKGFITLDERTTEIRGYLEAMNSLEQPVKRYIYGTYERNNDVLAYLQLSNDRNLAPLMFMFYDIKTPGIWSHYSEYLDSFFPFSSFNGTCQVSLNEITNPADVEKISKDVFSTFAESADLMSNIILICKGIHHYIDF